MVVIIPFIMIVMFNIFIFLKALASTRRVHHRGAHSDGSETSRRQQARDIHLLKHMLFIFLVFIIGWAPVYVAVVLNLYIHISVWVLVFLQIPPIFSALIMVLDLYVYNHDLRSYLKRKIMRSNADLTIMVGTQNSLNTTGSLRNWMCDSTINRTDYWAGSKLISNDVHHFLSKCSRLWLFHLNTKSSVHFVRSHMTCNAFHRQRSVIRPTTWCSSKLMTRNIIQQGRFNEIHADFRGWKWFNEIITMYICTDYLCVGGWQEGSRRDLRSWQSSSYSGVALRHRYSMQYLDLCQVCNREFSIALLPKYVRRFSFCFSWISIYVTVLISRSVWISL